MWNSRSLAEWRYLGKPQDRVDIPAKVTGKAQFGIDVDLPGMVYATVRMNPYLGGAMKSFDASDAVKMRGVENRCFHRQRRCGHRR